MRKDQNRPFFIVGCHRSGSTLLRYLLDSHPQLACPPESKFITGLAAFLKDPQTRGGMHSLGLRTERVYDLLRGVADGALSFFAKQQGKPYWVDKTPNHALILPFIDALFGFEGRFVILVRHPFDNVISLHDYFRAAKPSHEDPTIRFVVTNYGKSLRGWAKYWREANEEIHAFSKAHPDRSLVVKYEDLTAEPAAIVDSILDFFELERFEDDAVHVYEGV